jgi:AAA ATPase domain
MEPSVGIDQTPGPRTALRGPGTQAGEAVRIDLPGRRRQSYSQRMVRVLERDRELALLARAFAGAVAGSGSGVTIAGEPGAGKSTLVAAACEQATGVRVVRGGCDPLTTPRPLGPFRDAFAQMGPPSQRTSAALQGSAIEVCEAVYDSLRSEPTVPVVEDIHWIDSASVEVLRFQYMTSHLDTAIASIEKSFSLWHSADDAEGLSAAHESCAVLEYYNADRHQAQHNANRAADLASALPGEKYGSARVTQAYLAYHASEYAVSELCIADGARVDEQVGSVALALRGSLVRSLSDLSLGRPGWRERSLALIEQAREAHLDELASTGHSNVSYLDVEQARLGAAESVLEVSLPFTVERGIPICNHWQTAVRSRLRFREGRWAAALEDAEKALYTRHAAGSVLAADRGRIDGAPEGRCAGRTARRGLGAGDQTRRADADRAGARRPVRSAAST